MNRTRFLISSFIIVCTLCGCGDSSNNKVANDIPKTRGVIVSSADGKEVSYDWSRVITVGNRSYIILDIWNTEKNSFDGIPVCHVREILAVLSAFESAHPELEITNWHIDSYVFWVQSSATTGIWVDHKPRVLNKK